MIPILERAIGLAESSDYSIMLADALRYRIQFTDETNTDAFDRDADFDAAIAAADIAVEGSQSLPNMVRVQQDVLKLITRP